MGTSSTVPAGVFTPAEYTSLKHAGLLVTASAFTKGSSNLDLTSLPLVPGQPGSGPGQQSEDNPKARSNTTVHFLSLPNTGPYLRLVGTGRAHLLALLERSSFREAPLCLLRDRWDGAVETGKSFDVAKRVRGEYAGILPGRTKKWKELYGMRFRWALEEAVGAGLVEVFDTGSVGPGVRCL